MPAKIGPEMQELLDGDPARQLDAIVRAQGRLDELISILPASVTVQHQYVLISSVSVRASAGTLRTLALDDTVKAIEPVRDVSHM